METNHQILKNELAKSLTSLALESEHVKTKTELFFWIQKIRDKADLAHEEFYRVQ